MPGFDRSGPLGQGPMTGRGLGLCGGAAQVPAGVGFARGVGRGGRPWGGGRGFAFGGGRGRFGPDYGWGYAPPAAPGNEALQAEAEGLQAEIKALKERLAKLESG